MFSSGTMGKGIAVDPEDGVVVAPFDGTEGMIAKSEVLLTVIK